MPGWVAGLQRWGGFWEGQDSGLELWRVASFQAELCQQCQLGSGRTSHSQGSGPGRALGWWGVLGAV